MLPVLENTRSPCFETNTKPSNSNCELLLIVVLSLYLRHYTFLSRVFSPFIRENKREIKFRNASVMPEYKCPLIRRIAR